MEVVSFATEAHIYIYIYMILVEQERKESLQYSFNPFATYSDSIII